MVSLLIRKNTSPKCPLCNKFIKLDLNEAPDRKMDEHITSGCVRHTLDLEKTKRKKEKAKAPKCGLPSCKNKEGYELVRCKLCHRSFCLTHRHAEDHRCPRLGFEKKRREVSSREKIRLAHQKRLKEVTNPKGADKIPNERQFYLEVEAKKNKIKQKTICFDKNWTIGKCIDVACEAMGIENRNNDPQAEKTHFIGKKNKAMFPFDIPLYLLVPALSPGDTVFLGSALA
mmetsp:Transcript_46796/g.75242  ORF Transcript_46796/g.75242 Transcript_46796/m.75242 type:complete len:229 (-) Transcript_46796:144-830(-)|eukprot:jgi/Bigna1/88318/estExt_fgenesh1_pg.C_300142